METDEHRRRIAAGLESAGRYDGPISRLTRAREAEKLAKNPPITNPVAFSDEQMAKLSISDRIQISHFQKTNPHMSRAQIAAHIDAAIKNGWLRQR
jgi:hypothetical protein